MTTLDQIRQSIEARLTELEQEKTALAAARVALRDSRGESKSSDSGEPAPAPKLRGTAARSRRRQSAGATAPTDTTVQTTSAPTDELAPAPADETGSVNATGVGDAADGSAKTSAGKSAARRAARPRRAQASGSSSRPGEVLLADRLEMMLAQVEDGLSASAICRRANASYDQVRGLLQQLERDGRLRRTGARRTSLWRLISDEERIAERAAQLASQSITRPATRPR